MENNITHLPAQIPPGGTTNKNVHELVPGADDLSFCELLDLEYEFRKLRIACAAKTWRQGQIVKIVWPKDGRKYTGVVLAAGTKIHLWFPCDDSMWPVEFRDIVEMTDRIAAIEPWDDGFRVEDGWKIKLRDEFRDE